MRKTIGKLFLILMLLVIYAPILILAVYSFTDSGNIGSIHGFSMQNYVTLFTKGELRDMIVGTVLLALVSSLLATIFGTMGAIGAFYSKKLAKNFINTANQIPVVNADVVTGFSICVLLIVAFGMNKESYVPLLIGHVVLSAPFVYLSVVPKLKQMDASLYEAAMDLGASPSMALRKVVIPQIMPGIVSGALIAFTMSFDDFVSYPDLRWQSHFRLMIISSQAIQNRQRLTRSVRMLSMQPRVHRQRLKLHSGRFRQ